MNNLNYPAFLLLIMVCFNFGALNAQVTTSSMTGHVIDNKKEDVIGAVVKAVHTESGTIYGAQTDAMGNYRIMGMRVGGPYKVTVTYIGLATQEFTGIYLTLGEVYQKDFVLQEENKTLKEIVVKAEPNDPLKRAKAGTTQQISNVQLTRLPTLSRSLGDFTRLVPQGAAGVNLGSNSSPIPSFGGTDVRFSNISIDGSVFNNSFGISPTPGGQTGSSFISLDAIEQIQVSIAPYDVKQGGFTGAGVNMVTRSGTNELHGSVFYNFRNNAIAGSKIDGQSIAFNEFTNHQLGFRLGGPIIKDKLFFFVNSEIEQRFDPGTAYRAAKDTNDAGPNVTRVLESDLNTLSNFLSEKYGYQTGAFQDYQLSTFSNKGVVKIDYNLSPKHKMVIRANYLYSYRDIPIVNSGSFNGRRDNLFAMAFENSNFRQYNNLISGIAELNTMLNNKTSNSLKIGYTLSKDYRDNSNVFPLVDILENGRNYISFGTDPFSSNNEVKTGTFQLTDYVTRYSGNHLFTAGISVEHFNFKNIFTPYYQGQFAFNSLNDFYQSAAGDTSITLRRFRSGYSTGLAGDIPEAITKSWFASMYVQDEYNKGRWNLNFGLRADYAAFAETALNNAAVEKMNFRDAEGNSVKYKTSELPKPSLLLSPRFGASYKLNDQVRLRGGTGLFTGRPAYVFIGNQVSNNGLLNGTIFVNNTKAYPFNPNPGYYTPANPSLPGTYSLSLSENNYKIPQVWRSNLAVEKRLAWLEMLLSAEAVFTKQINNFWYQNVNQTALADTMKFSGPDNRPRYYGSYNNNFNGNNLNASVTDAIVLSNSNQGYAYTLTLKAECKPGKNSFALFAYNFGRAVDLGSAGSVAYNSWASYYTTQGNNYPQLSTSDYEQRHRLFGVFSQQIAWRKQQQTTISLFGEWFSPSRYTYTYQGDMNGDGIVGNDLLYIPKDRSEYNFATYTANGITFTKEMQEEAFEAFVNQDKYLKTRKGKYTERNEASLPFIGRIDLSIAHELKMGSNKKGNLQLRADVFNFLNLLNSSWGVAKVPINTTPLELTSIDNQGKPVYRMTAVNNSLNYASYQSSQTLSNVWQMQLGVRYTF